MRRREFIKSAACCSAGVFLPASLKAANPKRKFLWAEFAEITRNCGAPQKWHAKDGDWLKKTMTDMDVWRRFTERAAKRGANALVIRMGDGIVYPSHPELAIDGSWSVQETKDEFRRLRDLGLEPIPKLNFSAAHDGWLHEYGYMLGTQKYLQVVRDVIRDVCDIFGGPQLFHLGMDEEVDWLQKAYRVSIVRSVEDQWWDDLSVMDETCRACGSRAWVWSDIGWENYDIFFRRMPKSIVQSNWYYNRDFTYDPEFDCAKSKRTLTGNSAKFATKFYVDLDRAGYDQIPCGSNYQTVNDAYEVNFRRTVEFCSRHLSEDRLLGFLMASWAGTDKQGEAKLMESADLLEEARGVYGRA